jgi:hypothetical protein
MNLFSMRTIPKPVWIVVGVLFGLPMVIGAIMTVAKDLWP